MLVITLINEKGGVGKTTLATHIAAGLAARGSRVVVIDGDSQGSATIRFGIKKAPALYDLLVRDGEWKNAVRAVAPERFIIPGESVGGKLWIIPSNVETRNIASSISDSDSLAMRLDELKDMVDMVIIDTSPTPSLLHGAFYTATDFIIYPTKLTFTSFDGLVESIHHRMAADKARQERWGLPPIRVAGIIPVEYRAGTIEQHRNLAELYRQFRGLVWRPIPMRTIWTESESAALPVYSLEPNGGAALDVWELIDHVQEVISVHA
jgi:chromosome partitioning protein